MRSPRRSAATRRTSAEALGHLGDEQLARCQVAVYAAIKRKGRACDEDIATLTGLSPSTARPRRIELVARGLVVDSGFKVRTASGRKAVAWTVAAR